MGKPTGFIEFERELPADRSPLSRIKDWKEIHLHLPEEKLKTQGSRCMDCGVPFCHTGKLISGMASGCPVNNLIPEWNDLVYRGLWREALERLHKTNNSQSHLVHIHSITMRPCLCSFDTKQLFRLFQCPLGGVYFLMNLMNDHEIRVSIRRITRVIEERLVKSVRK